MCLQVVGLVVHVVPAVWRVCWWQVVRLSGLSAPLVVFPAFYPLCCFDCGALLANMPLFRVLRAFLAWFVGFVWVCAVLVICVACGAFVCVSG